MFGIDVSEANGHIDWQKVKANEPKVDFAFIKASEGVGYTDPRLKENAINAHAAGIKIGFYHFATLNSKDVVNDAQSEAAYFLKVTEGLPIPEMPYILDLERNEQYINSNKVKVKKSEATINGKLKPGYSKVAVLEPSEVVLYIKTFLAALGNKPSALYSYTPFLNTHLPHIHDLGTIPLWIAQYPNVVTASSKPILPRGWSKCWLWQFANKGKIFGINTNVDLNR